MRLCCGPPSRGPLAFLRPYRTPIYVRLMTPALLPAGPVNVRWRAGSASLRSPPGLVSRLLLVPERGRVVRRAANAERGVERPEAATVMPCGLHLTRTSRPASFTG